MGVLVHSFVGKTTRQVLIHVHETRCLPMSCLSFHPAEKLARSCTAAVGKTLFRDFALQPPDCTVVEAEARLPDVDLQSTAVLRASQGPQSMLLGEVELIFSIVFYNIPDLQGLEYKSCLQFIFIIGVPLCFLFCVLVGTLRKTL